MPISANYLPISANCLPLSADYLPRSRQMAEICFQKAPDQDLAQNDRFPMVPEGSFNCRPRAAKCQKSASKGLLARIWPEKAAWAHFHTSVLIAGGWADQMPKSGSKGLLARIWPGL